MSKSGKGRLTEEEMMLAIQRSQMRHSSFAVTVRWGVGALISWIIMSNLVEMAGTSTFLQVIVQWAEGADLASWMGTLFGGSGVVWAVSERFLRKRTIKRMSTRIDLLEKKLDSGKDSSRLTPTGDSRKQDRR